MSGEQFTLDKVKQLIDMKDIEKREQTIDSIVTKYMDKLDQTLGQVAAENDPKKVAAFALNFYRNNLKEILWVFVFAAKPKHRPRMAAIFNRLQELLTKHTK